MRLPIPRRLLAVVAVAAAALALSPAPVHAAGHTTASLPDITIGTTGAPGKAFQLSAFTEGGTVGGKVTLDFSKLDGIATPSFPAKDIPCAVTGLTGVCNLPDGGVGVLIPVLLVPGPGATEGVKAEITVTAHAGGVQTSTDTGEVTVRSGVDLVVLDQGSTQHPKIGDEVAVPVKLTNVGDKAAPSLEFFFRFTHGIEPARYTNCLYAPWEERGGTHVLCTIAQSVAPGTSYLVPGGFKATVKADTSMTERGDMIVAVGAEISAEVRARLDFEKATSGHELTLVAEAAPKSRALVTEIDGQDNWTDMSWRVETVLDLAAKGAALTGAVGDVVTANLGVTNNGPASDSDEGSGDGAVVYGVTVPGWAKAVQVPARCVALAKAADGTIDPLGWGQAGHRHYRCQPDDLFVGVGETVTVPFRFEIVAESGTDGAVDLTSIDMGEPHTDPNNANNIAKITLGGGDTDGNGGTGGGLPVTGVQTGVIAGVGGALVLLGGVVFLTARRRRMPVEPS
ncbi:LPXTG cell wall anchor domain-containing protein [Catellatospora sichuanensis]|uniref:LPXTG cell wall anchor domain-containing protein n=1 Tax=Catellatospora sichuanensis TaxID=1969805 RepID=UPI0011840AD5|nr:LPXTG cell wall anchor domain-containing protein [Catellatospora sichuanensis]